MDPKSLLISQLSSIPRIDLESIRKQRTFDLGFAHVMFEQLMEQVKEFESSLNRNEEVGAYLSSFGARIFVIIETISFRDPYFIIFEGTDYDTNQKVRLVQHTSQMNVLLSVVSVVPQREPRRIGFDAGEIVKPE